MTDRELLELAAKAAGEVQGEWIGNATYLDGVLSRWNPLTDDGDALRLAVKLGMQMYIWQPNDGLGVHYTEVNRTIKEPHGDDPYTATRRAIVRAAAEVQRTMENNDAGR